MEDQQQFSSDLDESFLPQRLKDRILTLSVNGKTGDFFESVMEMRGDLLQYIFRMFTHIQCLKFYPHVLRRCPYVVFATQPSMFSSTLVELHINVFSFEDCLYLLDGRFNQLRILIVDADFILSPKRAPINTVSETNKRSSSIDWGLCLSVSRINYST